MTTVDASQTDTTPLPTRLFSARDLGELALQRVGSFSSMDGSADPTELDRALEWMELSISHLAGTKRCEWLITVPVEFDLEDNTAEYDLGDIMGAAYPSLEIAYPIAAYVGNLTFNADRGSWATSTAYVANDLVTHNGSEYIAASAHTSGTFATDLAAGLWTLQPEVSYTEIDLIRRVQYESYANKLTTGRPSGIYIDRANGDKNIFVYPVQDSSTNMRIRLIVQTYPRSVLGGVPEQDSAGDVVHGFDRSWQLWIVNATAAAIGAGPVRRLKAQDLNEIKDVRDTCLAELMAFQNREKISPRLRRTRRHGG